VFFASLPALIQSTIIEKIAGTLVASTSDITHSPFAIASLEKKDPIRAYQALFDYIHNYSRHAYKYLVLHFHCINMLQHLTFETDYSHQITRLGGTSIEPGRE